MNATARLHAVTFEPSTAIPSFLSEYEYGPPKTLLFYRDQVGRVLLQFLLGRGITDVADITPDVMRDYMTLQARSGLSSGSLSQRFQTAFRFLGWCVEQGYIDSNPMAKLRRPRREYRARESFTGDELARMAHVLEAKPGWLGVRDRTIFTVLLGAGPRAAELLAMRWPDVDWGNRRVLFHGKGRKDRRVKLGATTFRALREWQTTVRRMKKRPECEPSAVWFSQRGAMTYGALEMMVRHLGEYADVDNSILHRFRHTFATEHYRLNRDIFALKAALGHESIEVTTRYLQRLGVEYAAGDNVKAPDDYIEIHRGGRS